MRQHPFRFIVGAAVLLLIAAACGGGSQPPVSEAPAGATAPSQSPTQPPAAPPATQPQPGQPPTANSGITQNVMNLSNSSRPGSTIAGTSVEQIIVGREYDDKKPEILQLDWTVQVDTQKVYFGFGVKNSPQEIVFTQTLILNGTPIALKDLIPLSTPPAGPGKKHFLARGLAVKGGNLFPEGRYVIEVYSDGKLLQRTGFDVKRPVSAGVLNMGWGMAPNRYSDLGGDARQIDPDSFEVTDEPIVEVDDDFVYYDEEELQQAYADQENVDKEYEPFPEDILLAIEEETDQANAAQCAEAGGTYDPEADTCAVDDPAEACLALGGIYLEDTCHFAPPEDIPPEAPTPDPIADCEASGGVWDAGTQTCVEPAPEVPTPDPIADCEAAGGVWDAGTQTCVEPTPEEPAPDPIADCEASGGVWDANTQMCIHPTP